MTNLNEIEAVCAFGLALFGQLVWKYESAGRDLPLAFSMLINASIIGILFYIK